MKVRSQSNEMVRVGIVEDHTLMREGMRFFVESQDGFNCAWLAGTAQDAIHELEGDKPDMLIVDLSLPDRNGLELIKDIRMMAPTTQILVISMHEEDLYVQRAIRAGAKGYLMKNAPHAALETALRRVAVGLPAVSPEMSERILKNFSTGGEATSDDELHTLTDREFEVFHLMGDGYGSQQIADMLRISIKTVDVHRLNIRMKLGLEDSAAVTHYAIRWAEARKHGATDPISTL